MKKFSFLFIAFVFALASYSQTGVIFTDAGSDYNKASTTEFNFKFEKGFAEEKIKETAKNYASYFTTKTSTASDGTNVKLTLVNDTEMARRVVTRLLVSLEVENVSVNGEKVDTHSFVEKYIMK